MNISGFRTYIGVIVAISPSIAHLFGFTLSDSFGQEFSDLAGEIITLIGGGIAIYGRAMAKTKGWIVKE